MRLKYILIAVLFFTSCDYPETPEQSTGTVSVLEMAEQEVRIVTPGAAQLPAYIPKIKDKKCAVVVNQSSMVGQERLVDTLLALNVDIVKIFVPEHGFRGKADNGALIDDEKDEESGLPVISLYGSRKKPHPEDLEGVDVILFDLQDVGVRCYTYNSTLHYVMEACAENGKSIIILDRPNPNGHYVDGPMLDPAFRSFVGMHEVPLVHGMTAGEYGQMIKGEKWINNADELDLDVVPCHGYDHNTRYALPVPPSPNLPTYKSILLYPSLVLFEGTEVSVGRGTERPFEVFGHPSWTDRSFVFTPEPRTGAQHPRYEGVPCYGENVGEQDEFVIRSWKKINLEYLKRAYERSGDKSSFFLENHFIDKLAGTDRLRLDILANKSIEDIRESWSSGLNDFLNTRAKYLLYEDANGKLN